MSASTLVSRNTSIVLFQVLAKDVLVAGLGDFFIGPLALSVAAPEAEEFVYGVGALLGIGGGREWAALHGVGDEAGADDAKTGSGDKKEMRERGQAKNSYG